MTQATQGRQLRPEEVSAGSSTCPPPPTDSASDNDASERSAREKFKKTSLASLSKRATPSEASLGGETESIDHEPTEPAAPRSQEENTIEQSRGRPAVKRALEDEDIDLPARENPAAYRRLPDPSNGHVRKRSRDIRAGQHVKDDARFHDIERESVHEEMREIAHEERPAMTPQDQPKDALIIDADSSDFAGTQAHSKPEENAILPDADEGPSAGVSKSANTVLIEEKKEVEDEEMRDGAEGPRKKRSRDQMDTEVDREQKIAATEEAKAQRRSDELDRADMSSPKGSINLLDGPDSNITAVSTADPTQESNDGRITSDLPKATFGTTNMLQASSGPSRSKSPPTTSQNVSNSTNDDQASAPSAFASSGFASFASSSDSPFSTIGAPLTAAPSISFASTKPFNAEKLDSKKTNLEGNGGFGSFAKGPISGFGSDQQSPFAAAALNTGTSFGGSVFGSNFGGGFGSGSKLTSFAAPIGNAKLGSANGSVKPSGSSGHEGEEKDGSESEGEGEEDQDKGDEVIETDDRFQHQDVETGEDGEDTIFSSRGKLYAFKDNNWKEAGNGIFKLNVISSDGPEDKQKTGRFIMRAHQTFRVLLNQPVFPQTKVGDHSGNEPTAKAFAFAVIEDGKPIPHMVRFGNVHESKTLYHQVLQMQHGLNQGVQGQGRDPTEEV